MSEDQTSDQTRETAENTEIKVSPAKRRGRPPKKALARKKQGGRGKVGRPKGDAAVLNEYKSRMLASPKSTKVLDSILNAALDDDHKHQAVAWKLVMDRMLPVRMFEQDVTKGAGRPNIEINITGIGEGVTVSGSESEGEIIEHED